MPFMTIDMLGGVFNDLSLAFKSDFNVIASVTYSLVVVRAHNPVTAVLGPNTRYLLVLCI